MRLKVQEKENTWMNTLVLQWGEREKWEADRQRQATQAGKLLQMNSMIDIVTAERRVQQSPIHNSRTGRQGKRPWGTPGWRVRVLTDGLCFRWQGYRYRCSDHLFPMTGYRFLMAGWLSQIIDSGFWFAVAKSQWQSVISTFRNMKLCFTKWLNKVYHFINITK